MQQLGPISNKFNVVPTWLYLVPQAYCRGIIKLIGLCLALGNYHSLTYSLISPFSRHFWRFLFHSLVSNCFVCIFGIDEVGCLEPSALERTELKLNTMWKTIGASFSCKFWGVEGYCAWVAKDWSDSDVARSITDLVNALGEISWTNSWSRFPLSYSLGYNE